jgi:hypothetical protein
VIATDYHRMIDWIGDGTGLPDTILHIHAGLLLLMIARLITRRSFGTFIPWWVVAAGEAFNEIMDRLNFGSWRWPDTAIDVVNTLLWPTIICLGVRLRPLIVRPRPASHRSDPDLCDAEAEPDLPNLRRAVAAAATHR